MGNAWQIKILPDVNGQFIYDKMFSIPTHIDQDQVIYPLLKVIQSQTTSKLPLCFKNLSVIPDQTNLQKKGKKKDQGTSQHEHNWSLKPAFPKVGRTRQKTDIFYRPSISKSLLWAIINQCKQCYEMPEFGVNLKQGWF